MAEQSPLAQQSPVPHEERGKLVVRERVYSRVAVQAARCTPGVIKHEGRFARRDLPRATTKLNGPADTPHVTLDVAMAWPAHVSQLTHDLRERVAADIAAFTGEPPQRIDVRVAVFTNADAEHHATLDGAQEHPPHPTTEPHDPLSTPAALFFGLCAGVLLLVLGAVGVRDHLVVRDVLPGPLWLTPALRTLAETDWRPWMFVIAGAGVLIGVLALLAAVLPRRRTHFRLSTEDLAWMHPTDVARRCSALAAEIPAVVDAKTTVNRKKAVIKVKVLHTAGADVADHIRHRVTEGLALLAVPPRVEVHVHAAEELR